MRVLIPALAALALAAGPRASVAAPDLLFNGFGTLGLVHGDLHDADFSRSSSLPRGVGASGAWSADVDSVLGAQVTAAFTPQLSAVVQAVAEYRYDNRFAPRVEWAYLRVQAAPDLALTLGRTALPAFMYSDSRKLHYALPWVRPPVELYDLVPPNSTDGIGALWRHSFAGGTNAIQGAFGSSIEHRSNGSFVADEVRASRQLILVDTWERGALTLRANFGAVRLNMPSLDPLFDGFRRFGPAGDAIADEYEVRDSDARYWGLGASYDPGRWFVASEWGRLATDSVLASANAAYLSAGVRHGALTIHATLSLARATEDSAATLLDTRGLVDPVQLATAQVLNARLAALREPGIDQRRLGIGLRWDVMRDVALKAQFDRVQLGAGSAGTLTFLQPGFVAGQRFHVLSLSMDFLL